ncbi:uncharacterized protein EI90DRAFT_3020142 [Cantharellus anzutake]|uniref:uncharacterized protein n=1 Tax=Cantharellus anzutake TaxID=1750568 RepID=UPI001902D60F|nr:uncharacterized protein EI90DRAFT_3020142 [Cantharellus anzutake]KAF8321966.1 hypothetical protein EI90DRAFT_3020142 [Cantharellus anzutake]
MAKWPSSCLVGVGMIELRLARSPYSTDWNIGFSADMSEHLVCRKGPVRTTDDCPAQAKGLLAWVWTGPIGSANCLSEVLRISAPASSQRPGLQRREAEFQATRTRGLKCYSYYTEDTDRTCPPAAPSMGVRQQRSRTYGTIVVKRWLDVRPLVCPQTGYESALSCGEDLPVTDKRSIVVTYI